MEWLSDPAAWVGLLTLVVLEIVLGVDNLIFIAILSDKVSPAQRNRARVIGLSLALFMRLALLASISWVMSLTQPLFSLWRAEISWRDVILIVGGLFLLVKATTEIHERLEAQDAAKQGGPARAHSAFWPLVAQIVVLDAVFSLDSVITAVGMVDELSIMMTAVIVAVLVMLVASGPLTRFILAHPSLIILCLGFLLMVGLVLIVDGLGIHVPKGYVYAAIGFSLLIEILNQWGERNRRKVVAALPSRERVAEAVLRMLGGAPAMAAAGPSGESFATEETSMVKEVLGLAARRVTDAMTPREAVEWIDSTQDRAALLAQLHASSHREFPVGRGSLDALEGVAYKDDLLELALRDGPLDIGAVLREVVRLQHGASLLETLKTFKKHPVQIAVVVDAAGRIAGVVTRVDLLESIAGELPDLD
jgi:predicted tellurium resistance membrane protein TerC